MSKLVGLLCKKGVYSKRKEFAPQRSKFFPYGVDFFSEGTLCTGKQTGSHMAILADMQFKYVSTGFAKTCIISEVEITRFNCIFISFGIIESFLVILKIEYFPTRC